MDPHRFDAFTKRLSRRTAVWSLGTRSVLAALGAAIGVTHVPTTARASTPVASPAATASDVDEELLFVQNFVGGTWVPKPDGEGTHLLTLTGHAAQTVYFADRPSRDVGTLPTERFLDLLGFTLDDPPNAAVVAQTANGADVLIVELLAPRYDAGAGTLTYDARVLQGYEGEALLELASRQADDQLQASFGPTSLFIDGTKRRVKLTCEDQPGNACNLGPAALCNVAAGCHCGTTPEGRGVCVVADPQPCQQPWCTTSSDCDDGTTCVMTGSCCGVGSSVCMPLCQEA